MNTKNMYIHRGYDISSIITPGRVLIVYGPRRSGKTTIIKNYLETLSKEKNIKIDSGEDILLQQKLSSQNFESILTHVAGLDVYVIDEAQHIPNIGMALKIIIDHNPDMYVITTGSSSFDLANKLGEPLVGRSEILTLLPFGFYEFAQQYRKAEVIDLVPNYLLYGGYPQVYLEQDTFRKQTVLSNLVSSYVLRDIFAMENIKAPNQLIHLVKLIALYIGQPVSYTKLAGEIGINGKTVQRYLELLEKTFVILRINPYSGSFQNSLKHKPKYYFYDIGIRNAILNNFTPLDSRTDVGHMWENFCVIERLKRNMYKRDSLPNYYYYQVYNSHDKSGKEIDLIEEYNGLKAFECKYTSSVETIHLMDWDKTNPTSLTQVIHKDNFFQFLCE